MMNRLFYLFRGICHLMLLLTFMAGFTTMIATIFWVFGKLDGNTVIEILCWAGSFFVCALFSAGLAYMLYRDDENDEPKPEAYDPFTGEKIQ